MVASHPQSLALYIIFLALTFPIVAPDLALAILDIFERHRAGRLARKSKKVDEKMKKYWIIDMRRLR